MKTLIHPISQGKDPDSLICNLFVLYCVVFPFSIGSHRTILKGELNASLLENFILHLLPMGSFPGSEAMGCCYLSQINKISFAFDYNWFQL